MQPTHFYSSQSNQTWLPQRVPQSFSQRSKQIPKFKPRICKRTHETSPSRHLKHPATTYIPSPDTLPLAIVDDDIEGDNFDYVLDHQNLSQNANIIKDDDSPRDANLCCFATFSDKHTGTIYNDLTGLFPFMPFEGNVCFLVVYHYETNAILALPISGFSNDIIMAAYKTQHELLESRGFTIKLNVMDNQASMTVKKYLTTKNC